METAGLRQTARKASPEITTFFNYGSATQFTVEPRNQITHGDQRIYRGQFDFGKIFQQAGPHLRGDETNQAAPSPFIEFAQSLFPFVVTNEWVQNTQPLKRWKVSSVLEVAIGTGAGMKQSKFSITVSDFARECRDVGFSPEFLAKLGGKRSQFEHHFKFDDSGERLSVLELGLSVYENDAFTCLLRVDLEQKTGKAIIFLKLGGSLRDADTPLSVDHLLEWLKKSEAVLKRDPLLLVNCVLSFYQYQSYSYVNWRKDLYGMESRLGVTERATVYNDTGYQAISFDYDKLNIDLASISRRAAETTLVVSTTLQQATALLRLAQLTEGEAKEGKPSITTEEIHSTILRAELFLKNAAMVDGMVESMRAVLYNRMTKHDTNSMKTIAVVTLFFLPSTFVSAVFSTGVFNFQASEGDQPRTVSQWAWVYLLVCLLLTIATLFLWLMWYLWGSVWLEKLHLTKAYSAHEKKEFFGGKIVSGSASTLKGKDIEKGAESSLGHLDSRMSGFDSGILRDRLLTALEESHNERETVQGTNT
ncbi:hypothetical protein B0T14DRAFT_519314 [Immersiella caudata]|uniref:Mg2+ transporter protein, CorA-like/Zinc transport protein ZntB n=1 Tax=Immersiella caudata TaxID=314043 RepID=A0AA39WPZ9_9PEZI|nr:hypothetical protein B0T14DRAFT_519314 [Immersiella caudata]